MFNGKNKSELTKQYNKLKASGPHEKGSPSFTKMKELEFAIRAKSGWGKVDEVRDVEQVDEATADIHPEANKAMKPYRVHLKKHGYKVQHQGAASELHVHPSGHSVRLYHMPGNGEEPIHNVTFMNAQKGRMAEPIGSAEHLAHKLKGVHHFGEATVPAPKAPVKESALGDALGSEEGVKKSTVKKDEYGNEVKHPARSLARKAMKKFSTKKGA